MILSKKETKIDSNIFDIKHVNNIIIFIRIFFFYIVFLFIFLSKSESILLDNELIVITLFIALFSIMAFIGNSFLDHDLILFTQSLFDFVVVSYLIYKTNFLDSPYVIFYAFIFFYLSFLKGAKGVVFSIVVFFVITVFLFYTFNFQKNLNFYYITSHAQYFLALLLISGLTVFLHNNYKKRVSELKRLKNLQDLILRNVGIGLLLIDTNGFVVSCNSAGEKIFGKHDLVGIKFDEIGLNVIRKEDIVKYGEKYIGYKLQDFYGDDGVELGKLLIFQDVTEKELLKIELEKRKKLANLGQFASIIAHEIKNPLGAIKGSIQLIKKQFGNDKLLGIIEREINRLNMILNNLLYVSRPAKKNREKLLISDFLKSFKNYFKLNELYDEMTVELNVVDDYEIIFSEVELNQIFWNLFINSYEAKDNVKVTVEAKVVNGKKVLEYYDDGPGIDENLVEDVKKPFFSTKSKGTGLGLYIIDLICKENNVSYEVISNKEFNGFKIIFTFH